MSLPIYNLNHQPKYFGKDIKHSDKLMFAGSCFSEHISKKLIDLEFQILEYPNGIVFNPISLATPFLNFLENKIYSKEDVILIENIYKSWQHHGKVFGTDENDFLDTLNQKQNLFNERLKDTDFLFITFGSAFAYELKENHKIVANCHKYNQINFSKRLIETKEIVETWDIILTKLNPQTEVIFTISPVKHLRDGLENNFLSKSVLRLAINELISKHKNAHYFPSYELVNDDLRDYRFYENDGAHPNKIAIDYVFDKFKNTFFVNQTIKLIEIRIKIRELENHKLINFTEETMKKHNELISELKLKIEKN